MKKELALWLTLSFSKDENRKMKNMIKAIFFDFDGVLVDSEKLHSDITIDFLHRHQIPIPDYEAYGVIGGNPKMNYWVNVYEKYKDVIPYTYDELISGIRNAHSCLKEYDYSKIMFKEVPTTLKSLKDKGYLLALASSSPMDYLIRNLNSCGINNIFDFIISGRDITESKPSPQIYNKCVEYFGLQSKECVVVEDSTFGIQAAKNAGLFTIAIKDYRFGMKQENADVFADNLYEVEKIIVSMVGEDNNGKIQTD